jgi:RND family efflux transporter MFP subunit
MVLVFLALVATAVLGRFALRGWRGREVSVVAVGEGRVVAAVYATGRVDTDRRATVRARAAAPLDRLDVTLGEPVRAGQEVARQDAVALRLAVDRAAREADAARAALAEAADAARRAEQLSGDGLLPDDAWVRARERERELRAQVAARDAALALAQEQQSWVVLRAPLDGVVSAIHHRAGDALREGDEVVTILELATAYLRVAVDERDIGRIRAGQEVRLAFDAYPGRLFAGTVARLVPALDRLTKSSDVIVTLPADGPPLQLDLTVTVNIVTDVIERAAVVPRDALEGAGTERFVYLAGADRRAERRPVRVGSCDEERCQVVDGVSVGEEVISPLPPGLLAGERVRAR